VLSGIVLFVSGFILGGEVRETLAALSWTLRRVECIGDSGKLGRSGTSPALCELTVCLFDKGVTLDEDALPGCVSFPLCV